MLKKCISLLNFNSRKMLSLRSPDTSTIAWTTQEEKILEPFEYLQKVPSKHHRLMVPAFNHWLKVPRDKAEEIEEIMQTLHLATLLLDDIADDSTLRYGVPTVHRLFGVGLTMNAATLQFLTMGKKIIELGQPLALQIYTDRLIEMHYGQGIDLYWSDHMLCPTEEEHIDMIKKKAASFFVLVAELLQVFSPREEYLTNLATKIGLYYCILDDYYNLFNPKALGTLANVKQEGRDHISCSDITERKFSLAVIHAMKFPDIAAELTDILRERTSDPCLKKRYIWLLKKHSSDEYMRNALQALEDAIRTEIKQRGGNRLLTYLMDDLSFQLRESAQKSSFTV